MAKIQNVRGTYDLYGEAKRKTKKVIATGGENAWAKALDVYCSYQKGDINGASAKGDSYNVKFAKDEFKLLKLNGFTLAKKISSLYPFTIDFSSSLWSDAVVGMSGLSQTEAWGAWSAEPVVRIEFAEPLPQVFDLLITASAFGPNINQTFNISLGGENFPLVVGDGKQTYTLRIINPGNASVLFINVPKPTSPKELGVSSDTRTLGLGLTTLEIRAVN